MQNNLAAHTTTETIYPAFVSVNEDDDTVSVTVRSECARPGQACGDTATIHLTKDEFAALLKDMNERFSLRRDKWPLEKAVIQRDILLQAEIYLRRLAANAEKWADEGGPFEADWRTKMNRSLDHAARLHSISEWVMVPGYEFDGATYMNDDYVDRRADEKPLFTRLRELDTRNVLKRLPEGGTDVLCRFLFKGVKHDFIKRTKIGPTGSTGHNSYIVSIFWKDEALAAALTATEIHFGLHSDASLSAA